MSRKFSYAHLSDLSIPPQDMVYIGAAAGYDYVSLRAYPLGTVGEHDYGVFTPENEQMYKDFDTAVKDTGIKIHDLELFQIKDGMDIEKWLPTFEWAQKIDCHHIITSSWTEDKAFALDSFAKLCETLKPFGITADFEFVTWSNCRDLKEAAEFMRYANTDNAGILIDTLHFDRSRVAVEEIDEYPKEWFNFIHLCDGPVDRPAMDDTDALIATARGGRLYAGEGCVDIAGIVKRLPEDVVISVETPHLNRIKAYGSMEHSRQCLNHAKEYFKKHDLI